MLNLLPWRRLRTGEARSYEPKFELPPVNFQEELAELATANEAAIETLDIVTTALADQTAIVDQARNFMTILAQRTVGGHPLFLINENAAPGEADMLRHAITTLQAMLEGTELPQMVKVGRVTH